MNHSVDTETGWLLRGRKVKNNASPSICARKEGVAGLHFLFTQDQTRRLSGTNWETLYFEGFKIEPFVPDEITI